MPERAYIAQFTNSEGGLAWSEFFTAHARHIAHGGQPTMGVHDSLRPTRRAGGIDDESRGISMSVGGHYRFVAKRHQLLD